MKPTTQTLHLQFHQDRTYIAISSDDTVVGFCTPEFAGIIVETFNEHEQLQEDNETLNKALRLACLDLAKRAGGNGTQLSRLVAKYIEKAKRPEHGTRAIAYMLRQRQKELDVSTKEFVRFCYSYKLTPQELKDIFEGKDISDRQLKILSRILGKSVEELTEIRDGFTENEMTRLARILGTSNEELTKLFRN